MSLARAQSLSSIQSTAFCWTQPLVPSIQSIRHHRLTPPAAASPISIDFDDESKQHTITIPPFLSEDDDSDDNISGTYPSLLHKIHVLPFLGQEESTRMLQIARAHAEVSSAWDKQDSTRHVSYQTVDFAVEESVDMSQYLEEISFQERIFGLLSEEYDVDVEDLSFLDLFCASYEARGDDDNNQTDRETMDRLDFHRDGSLLSFTVLLSKPEDFEGGGTIFDALRDAVNESDQQSIVKSSGSIQPIDAGYATLHSGKLLHGGNVVTKGQRIVLVGFVDVDLRNTREGALGRAKKGRSCLGKCALPSSLLESIENRSKPESIRDRRLITEDRLLRDIMLPRSERGEKIEEERS